jgi:hypothetical protein
LVKQEGSYTSCSFGTLERKEFLTLFRKITFIHIFSEENKEKITFSHIFSEENKETDRLSKQTIENQQDKIAYNKRKDENKDPTLYIQLY